MLPCRTDELSLATKLQLDLGLDSLLFVQLAVDISDMYNVNMDDCRIEEWETIEDICVNIADFNKEN